MTLCTAGSFLRFKVRKFKTESGFVTWAKKQVPIVFYLFSAPILARCCHKPNPKPVIFRQASKRVSQGRLGNGLAYFQAIVNRDSFKKLSQVILITNLIQV